MSACIGQPVIFSLGSERGVALDGDHKAALFEAQKQWVDGPFADVLESERQETVGNLIAIGLVLIDDLKDATFKGSPEKL